MPSIAGYQITDEIHASAKTVVYRGFREQDHCPVILKTTQTEYPSARELLRLQHEFSLTKNWRDNGLIQAYELLPYKNTRMLVLQDIGGISIKQLLDDHTERRLPIAYFLSLAVAFAKSLNLIHQHQIIHKDINPNNLVVNPKTGQTQIIDFGISTLLSRENTQLQNPGHLEGTLAYISPEQTGRMNRTLDYRSDFYSLGVTFHEMLTGVPPFSNNDPMELVHCHLAKTPVALQEYRPEIPPVLNALIQKLLAKTAENRYQSAFGLITDLQICQTQFEASQTIIDFPLGLHDASGHFQIPQKLYGRENEGAQVLNAFARVSQGQTELLLVAGYSGIGKTALVHEVHKPITEKKGYFINGKFDQFQRDVPYACLIQAFQELLRQLLTESQSRIAQWKTKLEQALGEIAQVIIEVIPELESVMGPQPAVPELSSTQAQNRFNLVFQQFIRTFATHEHPLVLFLDDLQWADLPSLQLMTLFMTDPQTQYLLIIGAYRDNEVETTHPLMLALEEISKGGTQIESITLKPLDDAHVQQLLAETLHYDTSQSGALASLAPLARLCLQKTQGNPFFLSQFLRSLVEAEQIKFNHDAGQWQWNMEELQQTQSTNNVVELMAQKIQTLPPNTQAVLRLAACIGNQFDLNTLACAWEESSSASAQALWPALQANLLVPLNDSYKLMVLEEQDESQGQPPAAPNSKQTSPSLHSSAIHQESAAFVPNPAFRFIHDRIQQAAYSLIDEASNAVFHLRIGRRLLAGLSQTEREERIFDLVYHGNKGQSLLTSQAEKEALAELNLLAGKKAKSASAYMPALSYFKAGLQLLEPNSWQIQYELSLALCVAAAEAAYLSCEFDAMDHFGGIVLNNARTLLDQVNVYQIQIQANILKNQSREAIRIALSVLRQLDVDLPDNPDLSHFMQGLQDTQQALGGKEVEDLNQLPVMTEAEPLAAMQILSSIGSASYISLPALFPLIFFKQIQLSVQYGNVPFSAHAYSGYGVILCGVLNDIPTGYRFGNLALSTLEQFPSSTLRATVLMMVMAFIKHWKTSFHNTVPALMEVYHVGIQRGDFEYATYAISVRGHFYFLAGNDLSDVQKELEKYALVMIQFKQEQILHWQKILIQTMLNLQGKSNDPCHLVGSAYDEEATVITADNRSALFFQHFYKMLLCYLFENYPQSLEESKGAEQTLDSVVCHITAPLCHFYMALTQLAVFTTASKDEQALILAKVDAIQAQQQNWASHSPMNYLHKWHLVEAERARVCNNELLAMQHYDQAITLAQENHFVQEAAMANELAGKFYLAIGRGKIAKLYLQDAFHGYQQWGALAKTRQMEASYPQMFARKTNPTHSTSTTTNNEFDKRTITDGTSILASEALDLTTVMKATQAISGEIVLGNLLKTLMRIAIENAGAQRGVLLLETAGEWRVEAEGNFTSGGTEVAVLQSVPLLAIDELNAPTLPILVIQYVERMKSPVVLDNASGRGRFMHDEFISQNGIKSLLCAPILRQGNLAGILYLENNLTEGAFTADRLKVLRILSSQAAISIENAQVYENLESTVTQRTAALSESNAALLESNSALTTAYALAENARKQAECAEQQARQALDDLRAAQTQLVQSAKMASLGHLVAGVAHELNTPIGNALTTASVLNNANREMKAAMLEGKMLKSTLEDFIENTLLMGDIVSRSCQRAATLITSFKQVAADQTSEQRRYFDLHSLVEDNIAALCAGFSQKNWQIKTHIPTDIQCDSYPGPLGQVIANLVQNAATHAFKTSNSGTLTISAARFTTGSEEMLEMRFSDDGAGMDAEILAHIFEPFYTTQEGQGGPGLGLSISLNIAAGVLGGTLTASSEPNKGAQFCLQFPLKAPDRITAETGFLAK